MDNNFASAIFLLYLSSAFDSETKLLSIACFCGVCQDIECQSVGFRTGADLSGLRVLRDCQFFFYFEYKGFSLYCFGVKAKTFYYLVFWTANRFFRNLK